MAEFVIGQLPPSSEPGLIFDVSGAVVDKLSTTYARVMGRIAFAAETVETALGLPPLPMPELGMPDQEQP